MRAKAIRTVLASLLLVTAGYAGAEPAPCPQLKRLTGVEIKMAPNGLIAVPVRIAGQETLFFLDTAATHSAISRTLAAQLKLPLSHSRTTLIDTQGKTSESVALTRDLQLGRLDYGTIRLRVMPADPPAQAPQGVVGADMLRAYDVDLDFANHQLNLMSPEHCPQDAIYWPSETLARLPVHVGDDNRLYFKMELDGHTMQTVLHTGMVHSALNLSTARDSFGISADSPGNQPVRPGDPHSPTHRRFSTLSVEGLQINHPDLLLLTDIASAMPGSLFIGGGNRFNARQQMHQPDLMLGMSTLKHLHVYIDYRNQTIYMTPGGGTPPPAAPVSTP